MNNEIILPIIGYMKSSFNEKFGIPRQPNLVNTVSYIEMQPPYDHLNAFVGLEQFSHLWLLWQFHDNKRKNNANDFQPMIRPPRLGGNEKIGIFASRSMYRPAPIGLSVVELIEVKKIDQQVRVYVRGADLLNDTPIIDIKPYLKYADSIVEAKSGYAQQSPSVLPVVWTETAQLQQQDLRSNHLITPDLLSELEQLLALDPTPAYQQDEQRIYGLSFAQFDIKFSVNSKNIVVHALIHRI